MNMNQFITCGHNERNEQVEFHGIPFSVYRKDNKIQKLEEGLQPSINNHVTEINETCSILFFLGMVTDKPEGSEWWGQNERYHYHGQRVYIGDKLGRLVVYYEDDTCEIIPVIFGVNLWSYELFTAVKENEKSLNTYSGLYTEPFASDPDAMRTLKESLLLMENDAEKGMKYVFGVKVKEKNIRQIAVIKETYREAGLVVTAVTGVKAGTEPDVAWKVYESDFFVKQEYFGAMDRLARRLYQFRDEIPKSFEPVVPEGYRGPRVWFAGAPAAELYSNVFMVNLHDMDVNKIDETGKSHTSSKDTADFGCYVGFGTYKPGEGYYAHMWSRDVGRVMIEVMRMGIHHRMQIAGETHHKYLYDGCIKYKQPHWKRIANGFEILDDNGKKFLAGKENDGHAALMLFTYNLYANGAVDKNWLISQKDHLDSASGWFFWQIENPGSSNFDRVLYSESEASTQKFGGYDLFSNVFAFYALKGYCVLFEAAGDPVMSEKCSKYADLIRIGIMERFTTIHPRYGRIFTDTIDDCWTWEYKRFAALFIMTDIYSYDPVMHDVEWYDICRSTYKAQKENYFSYAAGRQMGYGQGYLTETTILLDEFEDMAGCMEMAAFFSYHHTDHNWIVPEGVIMHPSGRFWFRNSDLGNAVQQGEIVKCGRLLIGLDDNLRMEGLNAVPRLPKGWNSMNVEGYKVFGITAAGLKSVPVDLKYERITDGWKLEFKADEAIMIHHVRMGPFPKGTKHVNVSGETSCFLKEISDYVFAYVSVDGFADKLELTVML